MKQNMNRFIIIFIITLFIACSPKTIDKNGGIVIAIDLKNGGNKNIEVIKHRLEIFGLKDWNLIVKDNGIIDIEIPDYNDTLVIRQLLSKKGNFSIEETYNNPEIYEFLLKINERIVLGQDLDTNDFTMKHPFFNILIPNVNNEGKVINSPIIGYSKSNDTSSVMSQFDKFKAIIPKNLVVKWGMPIQKDIFPLIAIRKLTNTPITSNMIEKSNISKGFQENTFEVNVELKKEFVNNLLMLSKENIGRAIAIIIDDIVYSYPQVQMEINGGKASISSNFDYNEALLLSSFLNSGILDVKILNIKLITK